MVASIEKEGYEAGCNYLNGNSCTTSGGYAGTCSNGRCVLDCTHECNNDGETQCNLDVVQTCKDVDGDGCLEWTDTENCNIHDYCDIYGDVHRFCKNGDVYGLYDLQDYTCKNGACDYDWRENVCNETLLDECTSNEICVNGVCQICNECSPAGSTKCSGNTVQVCQDESGDGCLEWVDDHDCEPPYICENGQCVLECTDDCSPSGSKRCYNNRVQRCEDVDGDGCLEWRTIQTCSGDGCYNSPPQYRNYYCSSGSCTYSTLNQDSSSSYCCSPNQWNIGGEVSSSTCCGDDSGEYISERVGDSSLEYDISDSSDTACCDNPNDCVYNGVCYSPGTAPGIDVDMDGDNDYCGDLGTWWDCGGSGTSMCHAEDYETCISHNCLVNCSARPCLANQSTCTDYEDGEMECVNTTDESWISSFVEYPAGSQDNEIYCKEGYYCKAGSCAPKQTEDICATVFDTDACGTLNVPSMLECGYASLEYCEGIHVSTASIIEATDEPLKKIGNGPLASSNFYTERSCIDTDGGRNTNVWGCAYNITSLNLETAEDLDGYIWCDYAEDDSHLIEYYCYEGNIRAARYECDVLGDNLASPQAQCKASATLKENSLSYIELKRTPHTDYMQ